MQSDAQYGSKEGRKKRRYDAWIVGVIAALLWCAPHASFAMVILSEIAWMGTDEDANNEWIEIYNLSSTEADVTGWTLTDGGAISITLAGVLPPHGVGVLERTDDNTLPGPAFMMYTGALSNDGGTLTLRDPSGTIADQAVGGAGWSGIGGRNTIPKMTAQRTRTAAWVTGLPTPGAENVQENDPSLTATTTENTNTNTSNGGTVKGSSSSSNTKSKTPQPVAVPALSITSSVTAYVNAPITLEAVPSGMGDTIMKSLLYTWNFGDAYTGDGKTVSHTYAYPGEYVVVLRGVFAKRDMTVQKVITVLPVAVKIGRTPVGDITLTNTASYNVDISGHTLQGTKSLVFPPYSVIKSGQTITIEKSRLDGAFVSPVSLYDGKNKFVAGQAATLPTLASNTQTAPAVLAPIAPTVASKAEPSATPKLAAAPAKTSAFSLPPLETPDGEVSGTETSNTSTIPLYQGASVNTALPNDSSLRTKLPYAGLALMIIVGTFLVTTRKSKPDTV